MTDSDRDPRDSLEIEKLRAEIDKLKLEADQLRLPWWKKPAIIVPIAVALIALLGGFLSGFFSTQRLRLKAQNAELRTTKAELQQQITHYGGQLDSIKTSIADLRENAVLMKYVTGLDRSQVPARIVDALPDTKVKGVLSHEEVKSLAQQAGLLESPDGRQIHLDDGDISWWVEQKYPAWRITLEFLARAMILEEANTQEILIKDTGDLSNWARPVYAVLLDIAEDKWGEAEP